MKTSELLAKVDMLPVPKARNLGEIGWADGYLVVRYRGRSQVYVYGPEIPELKRDQILANPYPDSLFNKAIAKKFKCFKIGSK